MSRMTSSSTSRRLNTLTACIREPPARQLSKLAPFTMFTSRISSVGITRSLSTSTRQKITNELESASRALFWVELHTHHRALLHCRDDSATVRRGRKDRARCCRYQVITMREVEVRARRDVAEQRRT